MRYHVGVHSLAQRTFSNMPELLAAGDRVGVAVSGGIDSVALLRLLLELRSELGIVLSVVHFNHKLRGAESGADRDFVARLAREFDLEFYCDGDDTARHAAELHSSVETAARELRYGFFHRLLGANEGTRCGAEEPPGLKPSSAPATYGTTEVVPFPIPTPTKRRGEPCVDKICTGHTLDDQAETVLMRVIRGTGLRGLGAIHPRLLVQNQAPAGETVGQIVRPLLALRRVELEEYLRELGQPWREDASNADDRFTRNRIRHTLLPLIEREFNPSIAENLAELSDIAREEEEYWENEAAGWMGTTVQWWEPEWIPGNAKSSEHGNLVQIPPASDSDLNSRIDRAPWLVVNASVSRMWLLGEPVAVQRRVIKAMGEHVRLPLEFKHVEQVLRFAAEPGETGKELSLPLGWRVVRHAEELVLLTPDLRQRRQDRADAGSDYEYELPVPGCLLVAEAQAWFQTQRILASACEPANYSGCWFDAELLPGPLRVRNWRAGDRFWPAHTKSARKIKELLQGRAAEPAQRKRWPVVLSGDAIIWMRGFPPPARFQARPGREAVLLTERAWDGGSTTRK